MSAPVYRNAEASQTFLGLGFPAEFLVWLASAWPAMLLLEGVWSLLVIGATYAALRLATHGRPPQFAQHALNWQARQRLYGGCLSASARARQPRFAHAPLVFRDVPRQENGNG